MDGSIAIIFAVCAILLTISFMAGTVVIIRTLIQVRETASRAEDLARRLEPTVSEIELAFREWREVGEHVSHTAESAQRLSERFEGMGSKAADAGRVVLSGIGGPIGRTMALMNAFKIGADVFFRLTGRNQKADGKQDAARTGRKTESARKVTDSSKEVGGEQ